MNILHVIPTFYPATYWGGPIYSVYGLCNALASLPGVSLRVLTTDSAGLGRTETVTVSEFPKRYPAGYDVYFCRRMLAATFAPSMFLRLWSMIRWADVIHLTGVYSPPTIPTLLFCRLLKKPIIWSPRGSLQRWELTTNRLPKKIWEWVCNILLIPRRSVVHVTSEREGADSRSRITRAEFVMIENGVVIPDKLPARKRCPSGKLHLMYLGRLHPIKGIENLLHAIKMVPEVVASLEIYGDGNTEYRQQLQLLSNELGLGDCVHFHGHVDGNEKTNAFIQADVCIVPSYSENFGMVVAESLAQGVPVIASHGTPWSELEEHGCGLWVSNSPNDLAAAIKRLRDADLSGMGIQGRNWMIEKFNWNIQATKMSSIYRGLIGIHESS